MISSSGRGDDSLSLPYLEFPRQTWREFRKDTPLTLSEDDLQLLKGQNEPVSLDEVIEIYLPLSRLLNLYIAATQQLYKVTTQFLGHPEPKVPYIIGIAGSVAVGKSTTSRILQALLSRWPHHPRVALVTTDGFLYDNAHLDKEQLRKGFPESYNRRELVEFLVDLKAGKSNLKIPVYSHYYYDIAPGECQIVDQPDIVIVEGLNVLQLPFPPWANHPQWVVSDFFDFTIYVDAATPIIKQWYLERFMAFRAKARNDPQAFFYRFSQQSDAEVLQLAEQVWAEINEQNLNDNILPFKSRARLILEKGEDHAVARVFLRKL